MKKFLAAGAAAAFLALAGGAAAITGGQIDTTDTYVGAVVGVAPSGETKLFCSGVLVSPTQVVTAAHCVESILSLSGAQIAVTFATSPGTNPTKGLVAVTSVDVMPCFGQSSSDPCDLAVLTLAKKQPGPYAALAPAGYLDTVSLKTATFTSIGYGVSQPVNNPGGPVVSGAGTRRSAVSTFNSLTSTLLKLGQNRGYGGTCTGDSGGPILLDGDVVAIVITGDTQCSATNVGYRIDTPQARAFLASAGVPIS